MAEYEDPPVAEDVDGEGPDERGGITNIEGGEQNHQNAQNTTQQYIRQINSRKRAKKSSEVGQTISTEAQKQELIRRMTKEAQERRRSGWHYEGRSMIRWLPGKKMVDVARRVVQVGGCLAITLPKPWVIRNRVKLGDVVVARIVLNERARWRR